ncbi:hypothetical protein DPMN_154721 [Dreissena polymorpha]|uniref:F5/8 type C domain-containing protein n=1 Tax=Dreissena polymorpha TaxID=45954 RepID=A0A9D4FSC4_DREPO|nr:hypothetical protein DPMN_154721 [Dreissena polymorpha]
MGSNGKIMSVRVPRLSRPKDLELDGLTDVFKCNVFYKKAKAIKKRKVGLLLFVYGVRVSVCKRKKWVTHFFFMYSIDCKTFITYSGTNGVPKIFYGNYDGNTTRTNALPCPVIAMCARVNPIGWYNYISMKFDIIGCDESSFTDI